MKFCFYLFSTEDVTSNTKVKVSSEQNHRIDLQREVLTALFSGTETKNDDMLPKKRLITVKRSGIFGKPVAEPLHDSIVVRNTTSAVYPQEQDDYGMHWALCLSIYQNPLFFCCQVSRLCFVLFCFVLIF